MLVELLLEDREVLQGSLCAKVQMGPTCHMLALIKEEKKKMKEMTFKYSISVKDVQYTLHTVDIQHLIVGIYSLY